MKATHIIRTKNTELLSSSNGLSSAHLRAAKTLKQICPLRLRITTLRYTGI